MTQTSLALAAEMPTRHQPFVPAHIARQAARTVNKTGVQKRVGEFFELATRRLVGGAESHLIIGENQSQPDLVMPLVNGFGEVKARGSGSPFRISVGQIEDYLGGLEDGQADRCLYFFWEYTVSGSGLEKISEATPRETPSVLAAGARRLTVLDLHLVAQIARQMRTEIGADPDEERDGSAQVATVGRLALRAPGSSDGEIVSSFFSDLGLRACQYRVLRGEASVSNNETPDLFEVSRAVDRKVPALALLSRGEADVLIRDGGPLAGIFPESQLPRRRYRPRRKPPSDDPF